MPDEPETPPPQPETLPEATPETAPAPMPVPEVGGRGGPDPVRYGDWEKGGVAVDF